MEKITKEHLLSNGEFSPDSWFVSSFNVTPNSRVIYLDSERGKLNEAKFFSKFKEKFSNFYTWYSKAQFLDRDIKEGEIEKLEDDYYFNPTKFGFDAINSNDKIYILYRHNLLKVNFIEENATFTKFYGEIKSLIKECLEKQHMSTKVNLITYDGRDYNLTECKIADVKVDIDKHYNDDFKPIYNDIANFLNNPKSGLVILHGTQGTGKTFMIRHIINNFNKQFIIINNSMMNSLSDPTFLNFILDHKNSVIILEDCEQLLKDRSENMFADGISNILNMTDGLYSDILNIKFIATFNSPDTSIDSALMRKGRLVAKYKFDTLSLEKTNKLLKELKKPEATEGMTLTDIYNSDEQSYEHETRRKIGF